MPPNTYPGRQEKARKPAFLDLADPKRILKLKHHQKLLQTTNMSRSMKPAGKSEEMSNRADDDLKVTQAMDDSMTSSVEDPVEWEPADPEIRAKFRLFMKNCDIPAGLVKTDNEDHYCICDGPDDGRFMIECSNQKKCFKQWFHLECIGLNENDISGANKDWFCDRCVDKKTGKLGKACPGVYNAFKVNTERNKNSDAVERERERGVTTNIGKQKRALTINTTNLSRAVGALTLSTPSPTSPEPWSGEPDKSFADDPEVALAYNLTTLTDAKKTLQRVNLSDEELPANGSVFANTNIDLFDDNYDKDIDLPDAPLDSDDSVDSGDFDRDRDVHMTGTTSARKINSKGFHSGGWSQDDKDALCEVVKTCTQGMGLRGEEMWSKAQPMLAARGVIRPIGGMKMVWLRELRVEMGIDERRRANAAKMQTAVQGKRKGGVAAAQKRRKRVAREMFAGAGLGAALKAVAGSKVNAGVRARAASA